MAKIYTIINEAWIISKEKLEKLINSRVTHISHVFYLSRNPKIVCRIRLFYRQPIGFQLYVISHPSKILKFYYKDSDGINQIIKEYSPYGSNIFKMNAEEECEIKITGMHITEANEYPTILRTGFDADLFGLFENNATDFKIIFGKNVNKKMGVLKKIFRAFGYKSSNKICVHKELLISHSPVFKAMFRCGLEEAKTNTLKITDFKFKTVKAAIDFFYGHDIFKEIDLNDVFELFRFADKYDIEELRDSLEIFCTFLISPSNVCQIANYSIQIYLMKLRNYCKEFIKICKKHHIFIKDSPVLDKEFSAEIWREDLPEIYKKLFIK